MTMRGSNKERTICEVLREINDLCQADIEENQIIRSKLYEAERMAKKMAKKLLEYNQEIFKDWWDNNPDVKQKLEKRLNENYITGDKDAPLVNREHEKGQES